MDTEPAREHLTDTEVALRTLITDLEDLVDWTEEALESPPPHAARAARASQWVAMGILGVLIGATAVAIWRKRAR